MMMEVEGGTESWCLRLLRHEMGHVLNHTYLLEKDKKWRKLFGSPSLEYSESYRARPYSKRFVRHLEGWYAQSHPEEDFAETVAISAHPGIGFGGINTVAGRRSRNSKTRMSLWVNWAARRL